MGGYPGTVKTPRPNKIIPYKFNNTNDQSHFRSSLQNYRHEETETANLTLLPIRGFETTPKTRDYSAKRGQCDIRLMWCEVIVWSMCGHCVVIVWSLVNVTSD